MASPSALRGASLLIILQVTSRLTTFVANQLLLRYLTAQLLGLSTQLEVYYLSVLFFARESLRVAAQRQSTDGSSQPRTAAAPDENAGASPGGPEATARRESQAVVNLGYLAVALGVVVAAALGYGYASVAEQDVPYLALSLRIYGFAAIVELLSEPCFVLMQTRLEFGPRAVAESTATFIRCLVTFAASVAASRSGRDIGVLPFALGQLSYGFVLSAVYVWFGAGLAGRHGFSILPRRVQGAQRDFLWSLFYRPSLGIAVSMMSQSVVKHILTQGDTFLVSILSTPEAQGIYALASNYGGLLARMVFQPVEESCRSHFSRLLSTQSPSEKGGTSSRQASQLLQTLLRVYILFSAIVVSIGPVAAPSLLALVAGRKWIEQGAGEVLSKFCYYIPLLAINGVAEAFVASVATESQVHKQSVWMGAFSVIFAASGFAFLRVMPLGATGLILANAINMVCRIAWSVAFIKSYFASRQVEFELSGLLPNPMTTVVCVAAPALVSKASQAGRSPITSLAMMAGASIPLVLIMGYAERRLCLDAYNSIRGKATKSS